MKFDLQMRKAVKEIRHELDRKVRRITMSTYEQINVRSPVDQGTFRANWNVSIDTIDRSFDPSLASKDFEARATIAAAIITSNAKLGTVVYINNSAPYAQRLENGYSPQRPEGVVKPTKEMITRAIAAGAFDR